MIQNKGVKLKVCVIIPTYNERGNITRLIPKLQEVFKKIKDFDMNILVVDDNSPDGTSDVVEQFSKQYKNVFLLKREKKEGLGAAYLAGFDEAINKIKADVIVQMDADFSHNPEVMPTLVNHIKENDLVIGSRYVEGGGVVNWNIMRKTISKGGNFIARWVANLNPINDCTSGYRAIRVELVKKMDKKNISIFGYAFLMTLLYEAKRNRAKIKETPITFVDRTEGSSKMGVKDIVQFFITCVRFRLKNL
ncbi:MAG: polyprenol monophosphomannose synthase [archaeon]